MTMPLRRALLTLLAFAAMTAAAAAQAVFPPGARVGMTPPPGMEVRTDPPGFDDRTRQAGIVIGEFPGGLYPQLEEQVRQAELKQPGLTIEKRELWTVDGIVGHLITARMAADGKASRRWMLLATTGSSDSGVAALVTVEVPEAAAAAYPEAAVRTALSSIAFRDAPLDEQVAQLPFVISDPAGFHVARTFGRGGVLLTAGKPEADSLQPHVLVSIGHGAPLERSDRVGFAERLLAQTPVRGLKIVYSEPIRLSGQAGYEIRADGTDASGGVPVSVVQWVRFGTSGFIRIVGVSRKSEWNDAFPRFRSIRDSIAQR